MGSMNRFDVEEQNAQAMHEITQKDIDNYRETGLTFPQAIEKVKNGCKVTRREWDNPRTFIYLAEGFLCIKFFNELRNKSLIVCDRDVMADDWEVVPDA